MSNYTKTTDFDVKDSLPSGDTGKIIRGAEFEVEFENIEVAIASKADATDPTFAGTANFTNVNITGNTTLGNAATDTVTISGDLAVDTDTLFVDVSSNRVGIGTDTPGSILELEDATSCDLTLRATALRVGKISVANGYMGFNLDSSGGNTERMRITDSGNVGIGTDAPNRLLDIQDLVGNPFVSLVGSTTSVPGILFGDTESDAIGQVRYDNTDNSMSFTTANTEKMAITAGGNVGIGTSSPASLVAGGSSPVLSIGGTDTGLTTGDKAGSLSFITNDPSYTATYSDGITGEIVSVAETGVGGGYGLAFYTGVTTDTDRAERVRIDMRGNVGIGTTVPSYLLDVDGDARADAFWFRGDTASSPSAVGGFYRPVLGAVAYGFNGSERFRIDASGNVGIGTTNPTEKLHVSGDALIGNAGPDANLYLFKRFDGTGALKFQRNTEGLPVDASVSCDANENLVFDWNLDGLNATCLFKSNSDEKMRIDASGRLGIGGRVPAANLVEIGRAGFASEFVQIFSTTAKAAIGAAASSTAIYSQLTNNASAPLDFIIGSTTAARIDASNNLLVGTTTAGGQSGLSILPNNSQGSAVCVFDRPDTANQSTAVAFRNNGTNVGTIVYSNTATLYNTSSDVRLKDNITDAPEGNVDALQVRSFDWKADGSHQEYGFIAQELEAVAPYAVTKGETEDDMWGVDYSKLVPMLVKEIQDLKARIATLEAN